MTLKHQFAFYGLRRYLCIFGGFETFKNFSKFLFSFNDMYSHFVRPVLPNQVTGPLYLQEGTKNLLSNLGIGRTHHFLIVHQFVLYEYFLLQGISHRFKKRRVDHCSKEIKCFSIEYGMSKRQHPSLMSAILKEAIRISVPKLEDSKDPCYSSLALRLPRFPVLRGQGS